MNFSTPFAVLVALSLSSQAALAAESPRVQAAFGKGISFFSPSEDFELNIRGRAQFRFEAIVPNDESTSARSNDFMVRRARLAIKSTYKKVWNFNLQLAFSRQDMEPDAPNVLRDAHLTYSRVRDLNVRIGQMKVPFGRQRVVSSSSLQMVDRAAVVTELNLDRDVGIQLRSEDFLGLDGRLSYQLGVFGGDGRNRVGNAVGLLYVARAQVAPFGKLENELQESDLGRTESPRLALGLAVARNVDTKRARSTLGDTLSNGIDYNHLNADLLFRYRGFSLTSEFLLRHAVEDKNPTLKNRSGMGYFVQTGYLLPNNFELAARFGDFIPNSRLSPNLVRQKELGVGFSHYFEKHDLKIQADYIVLAGPGFVTMDHTFRLQTQFFF